ncbi:MAG: 50S ribosomal protein L25/general stress protein Ctc [bacterium]|nr:MAG: 50S ribosomal protein L25/general stress protein Ctc [bacterium]
MSAMKLSAEMRSESGKEVAGRLRRSGKIPAVLYGRGQEAVAVTLDAYEISLLLSRHGALTSILDLELTDGKESSRRNILIKEIQKHPYRDDILHIDLLEVAMDKEISVMVPIETAGTAQGVKEGGILEMKRRELEIVCLPDRIPDSIVIDISGLDIGDAVHVSDIAAPEGVKIPHETDFTILTVVGAAPEIEEEAVEEEAEVEGEAPEAEEEEEEAGEE